MPIQFKRSPHTLTIGPTGCGKTLLHQWLSEDTFRRRGGGNFLCSPKKNANWWINYYCNSVDQLLPLLDASSDCHVWVDEMPQMIQRGNENHLRLATDMRDAPRKHQVNFIGTYLKQVEPQIRTNVGRFYLFFCSEGLRDIIQLTGDANLERCAALKPGQFIIKDMMGDAIFCVIEDPDKRKIRQFLMPQRIVRI